MRRSALPAAGALLLLGASARGLPVSVSLTAGPDGAGILAGEFLVRADPRTAWGVLTDFAGIPRFVAAVPESRVREASEGRVVLEQALTGGVWFASRTARVVLEIRLAPPARIEFADVGGGDFARYAGAWGVAEAGGGLVRVSYALEALPRSRLPSLLVRRVVASGVRGLLEGVRAEIERRDASRPAGR